MGSVCTSINQHQLALDMPNTKNQIVSLYPTESNGFDSKSQPIGPLALTLHQTIMKDLAGCCQGGVVVVVLAPSIAGLGAGVEAVLLAA